MKRWHTQLSQSEKDLLRDIIGVGWYELSMYEIVTTLLARCDFIKGEEREIIGK